MPLRCIAMVVLVCLAWGLSTPAAACNHTVGAQSKSTGIAANEIDSPTTARAQATSVYKTTSIARSAPGHRKSGCAARCLGACCCNGGMLSCGSGQGANDVNGGFDLIVLAAIVHAGHRPQRAVHYKEPLYGVDRPPKA